MLSKVESFPCYLSTIVICLLFTCPIMHAKTLSLDDHKRMNERSKKIYKHPQKSCRKDSIKSTRYTQCLHGLSRTNMLSVQNKA